METAQASGLSCRLLDSMDKHHTGSLLYSLVMNAQSRNLFSANKPLELLAYETQIASVKNVEKKG